MLIRFDVKNFRSFRDEARLDMRAALSGNSPRRGAGSAGILPVAAVYGASASGKSNLLDALDFMSKYVRRSLSFDGSEERAKAAGGPNLSNVGFFGEGEGAETTFQVLFSRPEDEKERVWKYGFVLADGLVKEEWLRIKAKRGKKSRVVFAREEGRLEMPGIPARRRDALRSALGEAALLSSLGSRMRVEKLGSVADWFAGSVLTADLADPFVDLRLSRSLPENFSDDATVRDGVLRYLRAIDPSVVDLQPEAAPVETKGRKSLYVRTTRALPDGRRVRLPLSEESAGTRRMLALYPLLRRTLESGGALLIDELGSGLDATLLSSIVLTFHDPLQNPRRAQLVFTTSDSSLLRSGLLRGDEIWAVEKDAEGASRARPLARPEDEKDPGLGRDAGVGRDAPAGESGASSPPLLDPLGLLPRSR